MNAFKLWLAEWKDIFKNKMMAISLIAIIFLPIIYSGVFLWAFWDPYGNIDKLPVAIVNLDNGADFEGENLALGKDLTDNLKDEESFNYQFVGKDEAYEGLENNEFYLIVQIPENFSKNATTLLDDKPDKLEMVYVPNESLNYTASKIAESGIGTIKQAISSEVSKTYAESMFDKVTEMADGYVKASDGASELQSGITKLGDGAAEIKANLETLASSQFDMTEGASRLEDGAKELADKTAELANGVNALNDGKTQLYEGVQSSESGAAALADGLSDFNAGMNNASEQFSDIQTGADTLYGGLSSLEKQTNQMRNAGSGMESLQQGADDLHSGIVQLNEQLTALLDTLPLTAEQKQMYIAQLSALEQGSEQVSAGTRQLPDGEQLIAIAGAVSQLQDGSESLSSGIEQFEDKALSPLAKTGTQLESGANQLAEGQTTLLAGFDRFNKGFSQVQMGSEKLAGGASELANGTTELKKGANQLAEGSSHLADGSATLVNGTSELTDGSTELTDGLKEAAEEGSSIKANEKTYEMMASPVETDKEIVNGEVPNYGTGLTPYFLSMGLFVGALLLTVVYPMKEPVRKPNSFFGWFLSKFGVIVIIGLLQAMIATGIILYALDLEVQSIPLLFMMACVMSITSMSIIQFLVTTLGDPGRFIAIIFLILQLTTSAGTFPLELIPPTLQDINAWLPMTYSVRGLKAVISSGNFDYMWQNVGVLLIFMTVSIIGTLITLAWRYRRLHTKKWTERQLTV